MYSKVKVNIFGPKSKITVAKRKRKKTTTRMLCTDIIHTQVSTWRRRGAQERVGFFDMQGSYELL